MDLPPAADEEYTQGQREAPPSHLLTKVESFSLLLKHGIKKLESTEFESGDYKWKVTMNLDGGDYVSVYLSLVGTSSLPAGWEVNAFFNFFIYNHFSDKYLCFQGKARRFHATKCKCGFSKLFTKNSLTEPSNGYLLKDKCVFGAEVFVIKKQPVLVEKVSALNSSTPYKREWNISRFSELDSKWESEEFSYIWRLQLIIVYPNGNGKSCGHYVSIFLKCVDAMSFPHGKEVNASCLFTLKNLLNEDNNHSKRASSLLDTLYNSIYMQVMEWFASSITSSWGYGEFKAIGDMHDPDKGFVVDDCCVLEIQLLVLALHEAPNMT